MFFLPSFQATVSVAVGVPVVLKPKAILMRYMADRGNIRYAPFAMLWRLLGQISRTWALQHTVHTAHSTCSEKYGIGLGKPQGHELKWRFHREDEKPVTIDKTDTITAAKPGIWIPCSNLSISKVGQQFSTCTA